MKIHKTITIKKIALAVTSILGVLFFSSTGLFSAPLDITVPASVELESTNNSYEDLHLHVAPTSSGNIDSTQSENLFLEGGKSSAAISDVETSVNYSLSNTIMTFLSLGIVQTVSAQEVESTSTSKQSAYTLFGTWLGKLFAQDSLEVVTNSNSITMVDITASTEDTSAVIYWNANKLALGRVYYSTVSPVVVGSSTSWVNASMYGNYANSKANVRYLEPKTTYYYKIMLQDAGGNSSLSSEISMRTK